MNYRPAMITWIGSLGLVGISLVAVSFLSGVLQYAISYACAIAIGGLVMAVFMRLRTADGLLRTFAVGGLVWLAFLLLLTLLEVLTR